MGQIKDKAADVYRDFEVAGVPASGPNDPAKPDIRALFSFVDVAIGAAQAGITIVSTTTDRDAFYATEANRGKLVYVNNNNGSATDPANGVYEYVGGAPRIAQGFYAGLATVVQPLVDEAKTARDEAVSAVATLAPSVAEATRLSRANAQTGAGRELYYLRRDLADPFCQFLGLVLIGDSRTWGLGATGAEPPGNPPARTGTLADPRNNITCGAWANLEHRWLGRDFYGSATPTIAPWPGSPSGVATIEYEHTANVFPNGGGVVTENASSGGGMWSNQYSGTAVFGFYREAVVASSTDELLLTFPPFTGYRFTLVFGVTTDGARYQLIVDDVVIGTYSTQAGDTGVLAGTFGNTRVHDLGGFKRRSKVQIRVVPGDVARYRLSVEAIRIERNLRYTNQGLIGTDSIQWRDGILAAAIREGDIYGSYGLGTNDRALVPTDYNKPVGASALRGYITEGVQIMRAAGISTFLDVPGAVSPDFDNLPTYKYTMADVRLAYLQAADDLGCDVIDHFAGTIDAIKAGDTSNLADGLHESDKGHVDRYRRRRRAITAGRYIPE